ncbi:LysR family transcriptional regulator [Rhodococcus sp. T7]|uniref:LysR family transcriptional regulator n=1 Tax=Rhodococcus sp. T7 TaxID=627444 RepID=UPI00135BAB34|nr:LysR family transcriptional regulator [Rhodococcus sp. T7]
MQINWMYAFVAVAEELHFGRAARRLNIAQPAVSQQIQNLEKFLGARLFDRDKRSVRLTDAGEAYLQPCRQALWSIDNAAQQARNAGTGEYGRLRLGYNAGFAHDHFVDLVRAVNDEYPHLELEIDASRPNAELLGLVEEGALDLAVLGGPVSGTRLARQVVASVRLGVLLHAGHPLAKESTISMDRLREETFVLMRPAPGRTVRQMVEELCDVAGFRPRRIIEVKDALTILTFIVAEIGVGFGIHPARTTTPASTSHIPIDESRPTDISVVWRKGAETPASRNVLELVRSRSALLQ